MPRALLPGGTALEYETFGEPADPAILLIAGFGAQMISWDSGFCEGLARRGRFVVRFDNRDTGLSTKFEQHRVDLHDLIGAASIGDLETVRSLAAYRLADLADDGAGLARALGLDQVHVVGASMGGMVAQLVAIRHPELVTTLTSMMSSTGSPDVGQSTPEAFAALMKPMAPDRGGYVADSVASSRVWASKRYFDERSVRSRSGELRPGPLPVRNDPTARGRARDRVAGGRPRTAAAPGAGDPWHRRHAHHPKRRTTNRRADPRCRAHDRHRHGPRPTRAALADPLGRDRDSHSPGSGLNGHAHQRASRDRRDRWRRRCTHARPTRGPH